MTNRTLTDDDVQALAIAIDNRIDARIAEAHICRFSEEHVSALNSFAEWVTHDEGKEFKALQSFSGLLLDIKPRIISTVWNIGVFLVLGVLLLLAGHSFLEKMWGAK